MDQYKIIRGKRIDIYFQYGSAGKKYILKISSGEIHGRVTSNGNTE